jgi:hypothetical protein
MPKNRDYTGLIRTPPSMAWLLRQRAKLKGQIDACRRQLVQLPLKLVQLQAKMDSIDSVFPLHAVQVDPTVVKGVRPHLPALLKYGVMTKGILQCLRLSDGKPRYTTEIAISVARFAGFAIEPSNKPYLIRRVGRRLKQLTADGTVQRHHDISPGTHFEGQWSLADIEVERKAA